MEYTFSNKLAALKPSAIREIFKSLTDPSIISFAAGNPSPESFPVEELERLSAEIFATQSTTALQYSITEGYPPLREAVAARQKARFGENMVTDRDTTLIVTGGQQGIELSCKVLCNEGDIVLCEDPSFIGALATEYLDTKNIIRACRFSIIVSLLTRTKFGNLEKLMSRAEMIQYATERGIRIFD